MLFKRVLILGPVVAALVMAGCGSGAMTVKPTQTMAITVEAEPKMRSIDVKPLTQVELTLPPVDEGFAWQIAFHDARYLKQVQEIKTGAAGAGATVSFVTLKTGRTRVRFLLLPKSAGREAAPVDQQEIVLTIQF